ncbi:MAG: Asp-tRNA(Asn)/Glu-tRNA(Gln) amidotransferase subunit GatC [Candidatus Ratteibacteria bacterium]|jgi:aspartyl-tRNA(Asn)/glutamyl-tRNA(Gln) amidotransferase subunit C
MAIERKSMIYCADMAKIRLSEEEMDRMTEECDKVLEYLSQIFSADTDETEHFSQSLPSSSLLAQDNEKESLSIEEVFSNAPEHYQRFFKVPKIL